MTFHQNDEVGETTISLKRTKSASATSTVYTRLKRLIQTLELAPGTPMSEPMVMELLDAGRTPVREALRRLSDERFVVIFPRRGLVVAQMGLAEVQQLFEARIVIEREAAFLASERADDRDLATLAALNDAVTDAENAGSFPEFLEADHLMHLQIAIIARNSFLVDYAERLLDLNTWLWYSHMGRYGISEDDFAAHDEIIAAISSSRSIDAANAMEAHVKRSRSILRLAL